MIEVNSDMVCAIIPAHNEEPFIGNVVRGLLRHVKQVIVVDDHSVDNTGLAASAAGAVVIRHPKRLGKGAAIKSGLRQAAQESFEFFLFLDGDGQHDPDEAPTFFATASEFETGLIIGNRMTNVDAMPWARRWTNRFMSWQIGKLCRRELPDSQCGYRMAHRNLLPVLLRSSNGFAFETESLLLAIEAGFLVSFVPVRTIYRAEQSKIRPARDTLGYARVLTRNLRLRRGRASSAAVVRACISHKSSTNSLPSPQL
ncbi:MAG: glycosyltransferase family 2 protein [Verrucomicrobia bacterium]|nr:glycosyltransferase family 2 protein [Verrucomicrobiota bacterium]